MGFGISTTDLPHITNYADAVAHYNSIKPIRGSDNIRPLGNRRKKHMRIELREDSYGRKYAAFILYRTAVVKHYDSGCIEVNLNEYRSQSTVTFANCFLPNHLCAGMSQGKGILYVREPDAPTGNWYYHALPFVIKNGKLMACTPVYVRRTDRKKAKEARAGIAPFIAWAKQVTPVLVETLTESGYDELRKEYVTGWLDSYAMVKLAKGDEQDWMKLFAGTVRWYRWRGGAVWSLPEIKALMDTLLLNEGHAYYYVRLANDALPKYGRSVKWYPFSYIDKEEIRNA